MKLPFHAITNGVVSACALTALGVLLGRGLPARGGGEAADPVLAEWPALVDGGTSFGPADAPAVLVTFSDFQCPFCAVLAEVLAALRAEQPGLLRVVYRHLPLSGIHPHARAAALAAECAAEQGAFEALHDQLYRRQAEIGVTPWGGFAADAGLSDPAGLETCVAQERHAARVESDTGLAEALEIGGTPTVFLNGRRLPDGLSADGLRRRVLDATRGE